MDTPTARQVLSQQTVAGEDDRYYFPVIVDPVSDILSNRVQSDASFGIACRCRLCRSQANVRVITFLASTTAAASFERP